ncbi:hypothetical protein B0H17DRAFT_1337663 [Mycena rosella]|uniref:Uncharacterized protein n=1 Tax=Mycena rosella TaxID=1033263 RepID=A0AAD7CR28_MYCRO|nr:hypothetical protein B0H17DRAFT_1337663 [Mycena rosella]
MKARFFDASRSQEALNLRCSSECSAHDGGLKMTGPRSIYDVKAIPRPTTNGAEVLYPLLSYPPPLASLRMLGCRLQRTPRRCPPVTAEVPAIRQLSTPVEVHEHEREHRCVVDIREGKPAIDLAHYLRGKMRSVGEAYALLFPVSYTILLPTVAWYKSSLDSILSLPSFPPQRDAARVYVRLRLSYRTDPMCGGECLRSASAIGRQIWSGYGAVRGGGVTDTGDSQLHEMKLLKIDLPMASPHCSECGAAVPGFSTEDARDSSNITVPVAPGTLAQHQELMTTNEPPQEAELAFIRAVMSETDARLANVEKEISGLQYQL